MMEHRLDSLEVFRKTEYRSFTNGGRTYSLSTYPYMDVVLHDHCNARCAFCVAKLIHKSEKLSFSSNTLKKIDFAIGRMGVREVLLLGGEPTLSPDLFCVIDFLKQKALNKICMTTNGHRMAKDVKFAKRICSSGLTHINLSLMTLDPEKQTSISGAKRYVGLEDLKRIFLLCQENNVSLRINTNVFRGNHDSLNDIVGFYEIVKSYCSNIKFSSLLMTDNFSTINEVTEFNRTHTLSNEEYDSLFKVAEKHFSNCAMIVINNETLGFVKNTMVSLPTPVIFNYNHGGVLMRKFITEGKIHGVKLLPTGDLSYSWNREAPEFFVNTD